MKNQRFPRFGAFVAAATLCVAVATAPTLHAHEHIGAGATSTSPGAQLIFDNAAGFVQSSGYSFDLTLRNIGDYYAGFYVHDELTFTALPATIFYGGPEAFHAAVGTNLRLQIVSVTGPAGGSFGFWEWDDQTSPTPTVSFLSGSSESSPGVGLFTFDLTEAFPSDPFGHIHDRAFSSDMPGTFDVAFRIIDTTAFHTPSELYTFRFHAVPEPGAVSLLLLTGGAAWLLSRRRKA
jgi:hypothetical protein